MSTTSELAAHAVQLVFKAVVLAARYAGVARKKALKEIASMSDHEKDAEIYLLREEVMFLRTQVSFFLDQRQRKSWGRW